MDEALAGCRRHLRDPGTVSTLFTVAQVWDLPRSPSKAPAIINHRESGFLLAS
jgi:hypothetical protein